MTTEMNFEAIQSPADLEKANQDVAPNHLAAACEHMEQVGFQGSMVMTLWLLKNMRDWHHDFVVDKAEGRRQISAWVYDEATIAAAMTLLRKIDIGLNDDTVEEDKSEEDN